MFDKCPANSESISAITHELEKPNSNAALLQNLFLNPITGMLSKEQREDCLRAITAQNVSDQSAHTRELYSRLNLTTDLTGPNRTVHDWQVAAQQIKPADLLPTLQLSLGLDDKLTKHGASLNTSDRSPNGTWDTVFADYKDSDGVHILQFGDRKVPIK